MRGGRPCAPGLAQATERRRNVEGIVRSAERLGVVGEGRTHELVHNLEPERLCHTGGGLVADIFRDGRLKVGEEVGAQIEAAEDHADFGIGKRNVLDRRDLFGGHAEFGEALLADDVDDVVGYAVGLNLVR